jgi:manganese transport protein
MAVLLQSLCVRLGVVTGLDLAQSCRKHYPKYVNLVLYVLCEIAIIATDLAEVIGSAIALNLLFKIPTIWGVVITALDVLVILLGWNTKHIRIFEIFIMTLIYACTISLFVLVGKSDPSWGPLLLGYLPSVTTFTDSKRLYVAMGIVGATCMPHNL